MAAVVIDISTGEVIEKMNSNMIHKHSAESEKPIMEILAPDGRRVFSIIKKGE
jgi:hypothetical protein